jgi:hypothetical protein
VVELPGAGCEVRHERVPAVDAEHEDCAALLSGQSESVVQVQAVAVGRPVEQCERGHCDGQQQ